MAALIALAVVAAPASAGQRAPGPVVLTGTVNRVVDGDTIGVTVRGFATTVRLVGVDTPETRAPGIPVQCFGPQAAIRARTLLPEGAAVRLVTDPGQDMRDRYGRLLAYAYRQGSRLSANYRLVASGHAKVHVHDRASPFRHADSYRRAERAARVARRGLWGPPCFGDTTRPAAAPPEPRPLTAAPPGCDPNYRGACVPVSTTDLDCPEIGARVQVVGSDPHRLDGDGDGWGCETYA